MSDAVNQQRSRWERWTVWPLLGLSIVFIAFYTISVLNQSLSPGIRIFLNVAITVIWVAFAADYIARFALAKRKAWFVRHNIPDLLSVIVPVFRPFRLLHYLRRVPMLGSGHGDAVRTRFAINAVLFAALYVYTISLAVISAERGAPGATIVSLGDALWWACVTLATVGYGDFYPVTVLGRVLAVFLMLGGVVFVGAATATVVSYLNSAVRSHHGDDSERR